MSLDLLTTRSLGLVQRFQQKSSAVALPPAEVGMTVFCDFDGPIVDVSGRYHATYRLALARTRRHFSSLGESLRLTPLSKAQFWRMKQVRIPDADIALRSGLRRDQVDFFLAQVRELVNCCPALLRRDVPQPGLAEAIALLHQHNIKLVLVTLRCETQVHVFLQRHGLESAFAGIHGTQDVQAAYQNYTDLKTTLLSQAMETHCPSGSHWMIGDTEADMIAAQRLGVPAIALTCGIRSQSYLQDLKPNAMRNSLLQVAQELNCRLSGPDLSLN